MCKTTIHSRRDDSIVLPTGTLVIGDYANLEWRMGSVIISEGSALLKADWDIPPKGINCRCVAEPLKEDDKDV